MIDIGDLTVKDIDSVRQKRYIWQTILIFAVFAGDLNLPGAPGKSQVTEKPE